MSGTVTGITARGNTLTWRCREGEAARTFAQPVRQALPLAGGGLAVVLEPSDDRTRNEAYLLNSDGSLRRRIVFPPEAGEYRFIDQIFYEGEEVAFVLITRSGWYDTACVFDSGGRFLRSHPTK